MAMLNNQRVDEDSIHFNKPPVLDTGFALRQQINGKSMKIHLLSMSREGKPCVFHIVLIRFSKGTWWRFPESTSSWHLLKYPVVFPENAAPVLQFLHFLALKNGPFFLDKNWTEHKRNHQVMLGLKSLKRWPIGAGRPLAAMYNVPAMSREPTQPEFFEPHVMEQKWMVNLPEIWSGIWHIAESPPDLRSYNKRQTLYAVEDVASNTTRNFELTESYRNRSAKCSWLHI